MINRFKTFIFDMKVIVFILSFALIPVFVFAGCAYYIPQSHQHYYKIQRLNINGQVMQTYCSKGYPWGTEGYVTFKEYPSGKHVKMQCPYVAEDIGTEPPEAF